MSVRGRIKFSSIEGLGRMIVCTYGMLLNIQFITPNCTVPATADAITWLQNIERGGYMFMC